MIIFIIIIEKKEKRTSIVGTFAMDLIVALEMSRLQMIKDAQQKKKYVLISTNIFLLIYLYMYFFFLNLILLILLSHFCLQAK